ncbi:carcinoembryonic antigen-related cell adhesion molecule 1-like isoform X2 [Carcharodon carcharias]|nr:carcinoembryonic antigen-related cell adhesion molecule 1-like isoform X2 [Carcharodon carcharias]
MVAATGSSVLFPGTDREFHNLHWEFSNPSRTLPILDYGVDYEQIYDQYKNRIEFRKSNGFLLLKDLHKEDTGKYKMTADLDPTRTRILTLTVYDPLSTPQITRNDSLEKNMIILSCTVQSGTASSIWWTRGGLALPDDERYFLSADNSTLTIRNVEESDSGYYNCTIENPVSRESNSYQLSIKDRDPRGRHGLILAVGLNVPMLFVLVYGCKLKPSTVLVCSLPLAKGDSCLGKDITILSTCSRHPGVNTICLL